MSSKDIEIRPLTDIEDQHIQSTMGVGSVISNTQMRASIAQECERCPKKCRYRTMLVGGNTPPPHILMLSASPWEVVIKQVTIGDEHTLIFYRCEDPTCLLVHLRQAVSMYWFKDWQKKQVQQAAVEQATRRQPKGSRRANRRKRGKKGKKRA
jgi:hypothetical protein